MSRQDNGHDESKQERGYVGNIAHQTVKSAVNVGTAAAEGSVIATVGETIKTPFRIVGAVLGLNRSDD